MSTEGVKTERELPVSQEAVRTTSWAVTNWFSAKSLTKRASLNALATALEFATRVAVGLVIQPLLVAGLGDYLFGTWKVLGRMTGYVSAASGRPTQALKWTIANHQSSSDFEEKRRRVATAIVVWLIYLPVLSSIGGLVAWFLPVLLAIPPELTWTVRVAAAILIGRIVLLSLVTIPRAVLRGENLEYKRMGMSTVLVLIGGGLTALALHWNTGLVGVASAYLLTTLLTSAFYLLVVRSCVPWFGLAKPSWQAIRWFLGISWWHLVWQFVNRLMVASDVIVLGVLGSLELVTAYALTKHLPELLVSSIVIVISAVMPGLGGIIGSENFDKAKRVRGEFMLLTWVLATMFGATILLWNQDFVGLWVGSQYAGSAWSTLLITLMVAQYVLIRIDAQIIDLTLNMRMKSIIGAVSAVVSLLAAGILVAYFDAGIPGMCMGFIAGRLILSIGYPLMVGRHLGISPLSQVTMSLRPAITSAALFSAIWMLNGSLVADTWLGLFAHAAVTFGLASIAALFIGLSKEQRNCLARRIEKVI